MFRKIVSNLPYHPAVMDQLTFYMHRLRQEEVIRRAGFLLTALVLIVQVFAIISPSKPSLATSPNDIIYGARSKEQILKAYRSNRDDLGRKDIQAIYDHYGIGADQIAAAKFQRIGSQQRPYVSMGRSVSPGNDNFVPIQGAHNGGIYERSLKSWDISHHESWYNTITGMSKFGFRFWLIIDGCGNIIYEKNELPPSLEISKKIVNNDRASSDKVHYLIQFRNSGPGIAHNVSIKDVLPIEFKYSSHTSNLDLKLSRNDQVLTWKISNNGSSLPVSQKWYFINLYLEKRNPNVTKKICNTVSISAKDVAAKYSGGSDSERCVTLTVTPTPTPTLPSNPRVSTDKSVSNITQHVDNANNTTAQAGDKLKYTIYIYNYGNAPAKNLSLSGEYGESINDILEYSTLIDKGDGAFDNTTKTLSWSPITIPPGGVVQKAFIVQVKNPLPNTPISASDPLSYDFTMQNQYGRLITLHLNKPPTKVLEQSINTLPNTGPGSSLIITFIAITVIGYFFYRNKLMARELEIVHYDYSSGGV